MSLDRARSDCQVAYRRAKQLYPQHAPFFDALYSDMLIQAHSVDVHIAVAMFGRTATTFGLIAERARWPHIFL